MEWRIYGKYRAKFLGYPRKQNKSFENKLLKKKNLPEIPTAVAYLSEYEECWCGPSQYLYKYAASSISYHHHHCLPSTCQHW